MAVAVTGALLAPAAAHADEASTLDMIGAAFSGWGISSAQAQEAETRQGFFVGVHSGLIDSGVAPAVAGISVPLSQRNAGSVMANGYYMFTTDWALGTYVGGGFGQLNLGLGDYAKSGLTQGDYAYQGMAGLTYSFTPAMALGLEYRYASTMDPLMGGTPLPGEENAQSLTLRLDWAFN